MKRGKTLGKKISILLLCVMLTGLCACRTKAPSDTADTSDSVGAYVDESGTIVYTFGDPVETSRDDGQLIHRSANEATDLPDGSITLQQAKNIIDTCAFEQLYLPCSTSSFGKYYEGTEKIGTAGYLVFSLYAEKNGTRLFVGTHVLVSTDGKSVVKENWAGTHESVKTDSTGEDKTEKELYPEADVSPTEAIFAIYSKDKEKLGLENELIDYTFEIDTKLHTIKSVPCYKLTPKLYYTKSVKMSAPIYVSSDGKNNVMIMDTATSEYSVVS